MKSQLAHTVNAVPASSHSSSAGQRNLVRLILSHPAVLVLVDLVLGLLAYFWAWFLRSNVSLPFTQDLLPENRWGAVSHPWIVLVASQIFLLYIFGLYDDIRTTRYREILAFVSLACTIQVMAVTSVFFLTDSPFPRTVILLFAPTNVGLLCLWRAYVKTQLKKHNLRVLIVGEGRESTREIIQEIEKSPWMGMTIAGLVFSHEEELEGSWEEWGARRSPYPVLGLVNEIDRVIVRQHIDEVILASEPTWKDRMMSAISRLQEESDVRIAILPSVYEMVIAKLRHVNIHDTPLISVRRNPNEPFQRFVKRSFDVVLSTLGLLLSSPLLLLVALLVWATSPGPPFYLQKRIGYLGRPFRLIKFRTMIKNAEQPGSEQLAQVHDPRVTPVGRVLRRLRIDEWPQLINVLKGDMSFVGPRPERPGFVKQYLRTVPGYRERHKVKPGITGLAQVRSYYHTTAENKLKYDLAYIYNYSFSLDLFLLLETLKVVLTRRGS